MTQPDVEFFKPKYEISLYCTPERKNHKKQKHIMEPEKELRFIESQTPTPG